MSSICVFHHHHLLLRSRNFQHDNRYFKVQSLIQIADCSTRFRTIPKSSSRQNPSTSSPERPVEKPGFESQIDSDNDENLDPYSPSGSSSSKPFSSLIQSFREKLKFDELGMEIMSIALPAALALAADPITSLVDTAFVGHLGSAELAAVGVSISIFNLVAKLFNIPLLNITTSFVAEEQAVLVNGDDDSINESGHKKKFLPSVSTSLALASAFGIIETIALFFGSGLLLNTMGIPVDSPMRVPAEQFTSIRAFGAPAIVLALAAQGTFRGFKDTKTPLYAIAAGNLINAILDPILIFFYGFGIGGAAIATISYCLHPTMEAKSRSSTRYSKYRQRKNHSILKIRWAFNVEEFCCTCNYDTININGSKRRASSHGWPPNLFRSLVGSFFAY